MTLKQYDTIKLNDNHSYLIAYSVLLDKDNYFYLIDIDNHQNMMFCKYNNKSLELVNDSNIINKLLFKIGKEYFYKRNGDIS